MTSGRPRVRVKLAMSLDGRTAAANEESQWITGEAARADVHRCAPNPAPCWSAEARARPTIRR